MALIKCPECSNEVSDSATACVKCGFVINKQTNEITISVTRQALFSLWNKHKGLIIVVAVLFIAVITNPSDKKHQKAVAKTEFFIDAFESAPDMVITSILSTFIDRKNFIIFSLTRNRNEDEIIGIGALGFVWLFPEPKASNKAIAAEVPRVIKSFEYAFLAAAAEGLNPFEIDLSSYEFDGRWWIYEITDGGTITATSKEKFGKVEAGTTLVSTYNAERNCFNRTIHARLAKMIPHFKNDDGCKPTNGTTPVVSQTKSPNDVSSSNNSFTDSRDGKKYRIVKIGNQIWMAENLNFKTGNSWCYDNDESYCQKYGRLYDWNTAMKACPVGWSLPTFEDWDDLVEVAGGKVAGKKLKSKTDWNGTDDFGFSALPGGGRSTDGAFGSVGGDGHWWGATEYGSGNAYRRPMHSGSEDVLEYWSSKSLGVSVRCVQR